MNTSIAISYNDGNLLDASPLSVWKSFKAGSSDALEHMYTKYFDLLCFYGRQFAPDDPLLVEDCLQDLFIQLYTNSNKTNLADTTSIKYYLMKSLRRLILNRKKTELAARKKIEAMPAGDNAYQIDIFVHENSQANNDLLGSFIQKLPPRQREAIYLRFISGLGFQEIAEKLNLTTKSVYKLIYKGLGNLKLMYRHQPAHSQHPDSRGTMRRDKIRSHAL